MTSNVLAFAGGIASGKSELSAGVAAGMGCPRVSFGGYVRIITGLKGLEQCRENWQAVGESLFKDSPQEFCAAVLAQASWKPGAPLVIDGVRHVVIAEMLKSLTLPAKFSLVFIDASPETRAERFGRRAQSAGSLQSFEKHSTETEVKHALRAWADLIVDGTKPLAELVSEVMTWTGHG